MLYEICRLTRSFELVLCSGRAMLGRALTADLRKFQALEFFPTSKAICTDKLTFFLI